MARLGGRIGVEVSDTTLLYGTAGVSSYHAGIRASILGGPDSGETDYFSVMASLGVGIETRIGTRWRLRGEYTSDFFPEVAVLGQESLTVKGHVGMVKASLIYAMGDDAAPAGAGDYGRWQGLYIGGSGGETLSVSKLVIDPGIFTFTTDGIGSQGWTGGAHAGANVVIADSVLLGAEIAVSGSTAEATQTVNTGSTTSLNEANQYWAEARLRAGLFANPDSLVYVLAGVTRAHGEAWAESEEERSEPIDFDRNGYLVGTGIETLLSDRLSARVEYTFTRYNTVDLAGPSIYVDQLQQTASFGLSYLIR